MRWNSESGVSNDAAAEAAAKYDTPM